jgi:hypothetical protein
MKENWIVDDVQDGGRWLIYNSNSSDTDCIHVRGSKELAQRVADGLNGHQ